MDGGGAALFTGASAAFVGYQRYRRWRRANPSPNPNPNAARIELFGGPFWGQSKWLGGELGGDGMIYAVPGDAEQVLMVAPGPNPTARLIGPSYPGKNKWLRGLRARDGNVYCIPCCADDILKVDLSGGAPRVSTFGGPYEGKWLWHGAVLSPVNGCIYCMPCNALRVLKIDPATDAATLIGPVFEGRQKWYGGLLGGNDGRIYGIPQNATGALIIDPRTDEVYTKGSLPEGGWKWHGGVVGHDGNIYGVPNHADSVLKIDTARGGEVSTFGGPLVGDDFGYLDGKYKYLGAVVGHDGAIWCMPGHAEKVLKIVPATEKVGVVGPSLRDRANKWQNGFLGADNCVYGIPLRADAVVQITATGKVRTLRGTPPANDKYEGGVVGPDGALYCMPLKAKCVMRIVPGAPQKKKNELNWFEWLCDW